MTDIIERLRSKSPYLHGSSAERTMEEAADEIGRLQTANEYAFTELTATRAEIETLREQVDALRLVATSHEPEALRLHADNECLRAALKECCAAVAKASALEPMP